MCGGEASDLMDSRVSKDACTLAIRTLSVTSRTSALGRTGVSIDDFGTGYSSLAYLSKMPLDFLKIDSSFVREIESNNRSRIVASTVVDLARPPSSKTSAATSCRASTSAVPSRQPSPPSAG
jgi:EAL domain-containing protein (putative c-di-GMP-specific phosphodiesterase class I)